MRVGLIGCGYAAYLHMPVYKRLDDVKVEAVADVDVDRARIFARKYNIPKVFANYFDLLELRDLDLIDICTPTSTHADIVCNAAKYGFDILLEKPMARTRSGYSSLWDELLSCDIHKPPRKGTYYDE